MAICNNANDPYICMEGLLIWDTVYLGHSSSQRRNIYLGMTIFFFIFCVILGHDKPAWWGIDFEDEPKCIARVDIRNRRDCCRK